jgi:histidine ammonia-lyase
VGKASSATRALYELVRSRVPVANEDRAFYADIVAVTEQLREGEVLAVIDRVLANL